MKMVQIYFDILRRDSVLQTTKGFCMLGSMFITLKLPLKIGNS